MKLYESLKEKKVKHTHPNPFADIKNKYVLKAHALGIVKGFTETEFRPKGTVNREELCTVYLRLIKLLNPNFNSKYENVEIFFDDSKISSWAKEAVYSMKDLGLVKGYEDGNFRPQGKVTIEESIVLSVRFYEYFKNTIN